MNRRFQLYTLPLFLAVSLFTAVFSGCKDNEDTVYSDYSDWRLKNETYLKEQEERTEDGQPYYIKVSNDWAPENIYALVHWHNDRKLTEKNLSPMDNSTVEVTYELLDIDGRRLDDSFSRTDSIYSSMPNQNILGVWTAMVNMHVGDTVTVVVPYQAGYGANKTGTISPYSTLIFNMKMKGIPAYEIK